MPRSCALYARFSSDRQNPKSCEDQLRESRAYAHDQGWHVVGQWHDDGVSGTRGREARDGWDQLLAFVEAGGLSGGIVLTWDIDRWSRDWADGMIEALRLHKLGVDLADTKDGLLEQHGLAGKILLTLKVAGADEFVQKLRRNVKRGLASKTEAGYWTRPAPYGWTTEKTAGGSVLVPHPDEAPVVLEIFERLAAGETPAAVARHLELSGVRTKRGSAWTPPTIRLVATSPVQIGKIARYNTRAGGRQKSRLGVPDHQVELFEGQHDALIPMDLWDQVQDRLKVVRRGPNSRRTYPLSGLVACGECGRACQVTGGEWPYRNYRCRPYGLVSDCTSRRIVRVGLLEDAVRDWAVQMSKDTEAIRIAAERLAAVELTAAQRRSATAGPLQAEIQQLQHKQARLLDALYAGNAPALINERLAQVQDAIETAQLTLDRAGNAIEPIPADELAEDILTLLSCGKVDLTKLHGAVDRIELDADPDSPPRLHSFGNVFELEIPRTAKDRTGRKK